MEAVKGYKVFLLAFLIGLLLAGCVPGQVLQSEVGEICPDPDESNTIVFSPQGPTIKLGSFKFISGCYTPTPPPGP